ncbi:PP2C family protein-serine/threonine phosphatase [Butyrivibrio sp. JL13D10]|uniref:PP2C family protein-serine/threonine phosphatase n=1 Tax=Butyrivibrio sp. JL13D10 TaxID=3236815 RepID=UPI0038B41FBF
MNIFTSIQTDTGTTKEINQDSCLLKVARMQDGRRISLAVICDGMGGLSCGELASTAFIRRMEKWFNEELPEILSQRAVTTQLDSSEDDDRIWAGVQYSWSCLVASMNKEIAEYGNRNGIMLGTTNISQLIIEDKYIAMWIGDSRLYETNGQSIRLLTHDHSLIQQQIDRGQLTEADAKTSNHKSVLLQCIGASEQVRPDFVMGQINDDTSYILCSDGLWRELSVEELLMYSRQSEKLDYNAGTMINIVKGRGETDNISVVLINCRVA